MDATVIVPTYKRPDDLRRCLDALKKQTKLPVRVIVVRRVDHAHLQEARVEPHKPRQPLPRQLRVANDRRQRF